MDREHIFFRMVQDILGIGKEIKCMVKEYYFLLGMLRYMRVNSMKINFMVSAINIIMIEVNYLEV